MKNLIFCALGLLLFGCAADVDIFEEVLITPSKVTLVFPENNEECTAGTIISESESEVVFDWTDAEVGDRYELSLVNLSTGQEVIFDSDSSSLPITLLRGTPYRWRVDTFLADLNEPTRSDTESFYNSGTGTQSFIPFPAAAISPENGALLTTSSTTVTLQWSAEDLDGDITSYDIYFGTTSDPGLLAEDLSTTTLANVTISAGQTYYWKVVTQDALGNESNSEIFRFIVAD